MLPHIELIVEVRSDLPQTMWAAAERVARMATDGQGALPAVGPVFMRRAELQNAYVDATGQRFNPAPGHEFHKVSAIMAHPSEGDASGLVLCARLIEAVEGELDMRQALVGADKPATGVQAEAYKARRWTPELYAELLAMASKFPKQVYRPKP
jgi:hypothetical protein